MDYYISHILGYIELEFPVPNTDLYDVDSVPSIHRWNRTYPVG